MLALIRSRPTLIWLLLVAATALSWESNSSGLAAHLSGAVVIVIAFAKVRLVGLEYMELRGAPWPMRLMFEGWVAIVCAVLLALHWMTTPADGRAPPAGSVHRGVEHLASSVR